MTEPVRLETLIKESCREWASGVTADPGLGERVLARPGGRRFAVPLAAVMTVLVVGLVLALVTRPGDDAATRPATPEFSTQTDPGHYQPTRLVAAGQVALAAYGTRPRDDGYTWHVYDAANDRYVTVPWGLVRVAPGLGEAAVLEHSGARRVGLLNLATMKVTRWLPTTAPVSSVDWSPDARRLVVTNTARRTVSGRAYTVRSGFTVVDVATGRGTFVSLPVKLPTSSDLVDTMALESPDQVSWNRTGRVVWVPRPDTSGERDFYDLKGRPVTAPGHEGKENVDSPLSPDGTLLATTGAEGYGMGPAVSVTSLVSGKRAKVLILEHAVVWADDSHVIGVACDPKACTGTGEFHNRYALAGLDGTLVPLTGYGNSQSEQAYLPQFVPRRATR